MLSDHLLHRRSKRQMASDLFTEFYTGEFYRFAVLPTYRLVIKINAMEEDEKAVYLRAIAEGWVQGISPEQERDNFITAAEQSLDASTAHYRHFHGTDQHTEHEALVMFLYFWVRTDRLIEADLIDSELFAELFCNSFTYYDDFMHKLAEIIEQSSEQGAAPSWIGAMRRIESVLDAK